MNRWEKIEGSPFPSGVKWIAQERAFNFSLYSKHGNRVRLLLYEADDVAHPIFSYDLDFKKNKSGPVWHCRVSENDAAAARYYAYQVDGPEPGEGFDWHCFDFEKILLDPIAPSIFFPDTFDRAAACRPGSNAGRAALGVLPTELSAFDWEDDRQPRHDHDLVIYEMHVRGFTRRSSSGVVDELRGTFLGVAEKIPYLKELGITAVELLPVFQFDPQEGNYWGYVPLSFFSPHHQYATNPSACDQQNEFRAMVKALHAADIEVFLDVVYNHTCEGDQHGPTYSLKGIDSSSFYMMTGDPESPFANFSGTGNTLHTANRAVRRGIVESLKYWDTQMGVDGFRFDLASIFTRDSDGSVNLDDPPIVSHIATEPEFADNRLIAEPWDAQGEFQLGNKFPGKLWMQWNARFRDTLQRFLRGEPGLIAELTTRLYGSDDLFPDDCFHACRPTMSVNYVTSHDGFTLYDLVSYSEKRNWANGHNNTDGPTEFSWNCGWEGDENVPAEIVKLRKQQVKNAFCLLMLSNGTPMFRMGDEFLQTQNGNNNPYNQDNETSWMDWSRLEANRDVFRFFKNMIAFRKDHPSICRSRFWRGDVQWYGVDQQVDTADDAQQLAYCLHGASQNDGDLYVMINGAAESVEFAIHAGPANRWSRVIDTARDSPEDILPAGAADLETSTYLVESRSVVVLCRPIHSHERNPTTR